MTVAEQPVSAEPVLGPDAWHAMTARDALETLHVDNNGLSTSDADARLAKFGHNELSSGVRRTWVNRIADQVRNPLITVLLVAAALSSLLGHTLDSAVILVVVAANITIGMVQEGRAEQALHAIRNMISPKATVLRDGHRVTIDGREIVPGDIVLIEPGDRVTADLRILSSRNLKIDESILTGESVPVEKSSSPVDGKAALAERFSMAYSGTLVTAGQATGLAVATGSACELGRISGLISQVTVLETPLIRQMNEFARHITVLILSIAAMMFVFAVMVRGYPWPEAFMIIVVMAVAAIPEGLPAVITITLAIGVQRMAARKAIIRRLPAVETLGAVSTICSDKTGTLTKNEMTVSAMSCAGGDFQISGVGYTPEGDITVVGVAADEAAQAIVADVARAALLCSDAELRQSDGTWIIDGDPMEGALIVLGCKAGLSAPDVRQQYPRLDVIPFDADHRFMATLNGSPEGARSISVKGAPERVIAMCTLQRRGGNTEPIDAESWHAAIETMANRGQRVLAIAGKPAADDQTDITFKDVESGLVLLGIAGLIDPPRDEAIAAIAECRRAGIAVKMITGDHVTTASAIAGQLGLDASAAATGLDLDHLEPDALRKTANTTNVFARTSPEHKLRLVEALQSSGAVIAMTGDGVNDAPALKRADVGVAMGRNGTEVAKEASDMVLADDNFASIVAAVREGRTVYDNVLKVIGFILPVNGGESIVIAFAVLFGLTLPMTPLQVLWVNMVSSVALALTLAFEPAERDIMQRPPRRPNEPILSRFLLWRVAFVSLLFAVATFGVFAFAKSRGMDVGYARTMAVNMLVVMEVFYLFSVRYLRSPSMTFEGALGTTPVLIGLAAIVVLQLSLTYLPIMQTLFGTQAIGLADGLIILAIGAFSLFILEGEKAIRSWLFKPK
jgi:magnesium-transporting ATPase (P-type)